MEPVMKLCDSREAALRAVGWLRSVPPFAARYVLGFTFVSSGWTKIHDLGNVTAFFAGLHLPAPDFMARLVAGSELACGGLLLIGLFTRIATLPLLATMGVALATAKRADITSVLAFFGLAETAYVVLLLYILILGPGALSVDEAIAFDLQSRRSSSRAAPERGVESAQPA